MKPIIVVSDFPGNGNPEFGECTGSSGGFSWHNDDPEGKARAVAKMIELLESSPDQSISLVRLWVPDKIAGQPQAITKWIDDFTSDLRELPPQTTDYADDL